MMEGEKITVKAHVKPEAVQFFKEHGCLIEEQPTGYKTIIFPVGSRKERLSETSRYCSTILLPDATEITSIECEGESILLLLDLSQGRTTYLTV